MVDQLARALYGVSTTEEHDSAHPRLLTRTEDVPVQAADAWRTAATPLEPRPANGTFDGQTVGIFKTPDQNFVVAQAQYNDVNEPLYIYTQVPRQTLQKMQGQLEGLLTELPHNHEAVLPALSLAFLNGSKVWTTHARAAALQTLLDEFNGDFAHLLSFFNLAISKDRVLITNHDGDTQSRLAIVQGVMALLPSCIRADLTFSTFTPKLAETIRTRVVFGKPTNTTRHIVDWTQRHQLDDDTPWSAYTDLLARLWQGNIAAMLEAVDQFDVLVNCDSDIPDWIDRLPKLTEAFVFNTRVVAQDDAITIDDLKEALIESDQLPDAWRRHYAELLLPSTLEEKDAETSSILAAQMDSDPELDTKLQDEMVGMLEDVPDLVYVFIRQRLGDGIDERWLRRLHDAAEASMAVAIYSSNTELISSWLRLIAREPDYFELEDVLYDGIHAAVPFAKQDKDFAVTLLVIAARFAADVLAELLNDEAFMESLPATYTNAFTKFDRDALAELQNKSTSLFLAGMGRAAAAQAGSAFDTNTIERLWALQKGDKKYNMEAPYTPEKVLQTCAETGADWLPTATLETLLSIALNARDSGLFPTITTHLSERGTLGLHLSGALIRNGINTSRALDTVSMLVSSGKLKPADALSVYSMLLEAWGWGEETQPIMESTARLLMQNADLNLPVNILNKMLSTAADLRDEAIARAAALHLLATHQNDEDEAFVEVGQQVFSLLAWSNTARDATLEWWRQFALSQPTARLTRLEAGLEGSRVTENAQQTLRSMIALRRLIGKRDIATFAQDINTAYNILETLSEAFGATGKNSGTSFEPHMVRTVFGEMLEELSPQQRQILSNSLKGLATVIAKMGDNRTKAGLGRTNDSLDRQLMMGEINPQSSVDAMKWIAGFFAGTHKQDEDDA